ncbi:MAG: PorP/SprF family type IX secretion system membrane protein [Chitinophagales bacterium]|jgi:type IX secretion system PorP/SprF family membrane protein|nr:PorP/SprF family type IX secretion system membrane protein [Chitinophagales bacterium]
MKSVKHCSIFVIIFWVKFLVAQDLQYSQFNSVPIKLNPAFSGNNPCNLRAGVIARNQWMGIENLNPYQSASLGVDFNLMVDEEKRSFWGFGFLAEYDRSGNSNFYNHNVSLSAAYHIVFGYNAQNSLSFGYQLGIHQRGINAQNLIFDEDIDYYGRLIGNGNNLINTKTYLDMNFGSILTLNPNENLNMYIGASIFHFNQPDIALNDQAYNLPFRYNIHGGLTKKWEKLILNPSFYYQYQNLSNWNLGTYFGMKLSPENAVYTEVVGYIGAWYKSNDAIALAARLNVNQFQAIFSYDIHTGKLGQNYQGIGSPELSLQYLLCFKKNSKRMGCPNL